MSIRTRKAESAPPERPGTVERHRALRGGSAGMWIAVIVALLVGLAGGYSLGRGPTRTVTKTVTETVAPSAYTTSHDVQAQVTLYRFEVFPPYCGYNGPAEVAAGTLLTLGYEPAWKAVPRHHETKVVFGRLDPGTTWEDVAGVAGFSTTGPGPSFLQGFDFVDPGGSMTKQLTEGVWGIWCLDLTNHRPFAGTILRVFERRFGATTDSSG
ncbi:MAG TPA: hypothetical protein VE173_09145 [Longimicrobiales bacterium]|nr:hypothetical protein [Longimicrobiales bacterium]